MNDELKERAFAILCGMVANPSIVESGDEESPHKSQRLINSAYSLANIFEAGPREIDESLD